MRVLFRLAQQAFHYRTRMFIAWTTMVLAAAMFVAVPWIVGTAVEETLKAETASSRLWLLGGLLLAFTGARGVFQYLNQYLGESIAHRVCYNLRNSVYDKLQRISFAFHDQEHTGNLMSKATVDIEMVRMFITMGLIRSFQMGMLILFAAVLVLRMDLLLGLVTLLFVPVLAVMAARISMRMRSMWRLVQDEMGRMTTVLQENLTGMRVVKAFGAEEFENAKFKERSDSVYANTYVAERLRASNNALMQVVFWSTTGLVLWLGGRAVVDGRLSANELTQFILYVSLLVQPVRMLGQMVSTYARAHSAGERIFEVLDAESPVIERPNAVPLQKVEGHVAFDNVSFAYAVQPAVSGVSLVLAPGQVGALMGAPGVGQDDVGAPPRPILRRSRWPHHHRRRRHPGYDAGVATADSGHRAARRVPLQRHCPREHRLRQAGCHSGRGNSRRQDGAARRRNHGHVRWLRHHGGRARGYPLRWPATTPLHRPDFADRPSDSGA